jgi:predicted small secreted protein
MKTTKLTIFTAVILLASSFTFSSCKACNGKGREKEGTKSTDLTTR